MDSTENIRILFEADTQSIDDASDRINILNKRNEELKGLVKELDKEYISFYQNLSSAGKTYQQVQDELGKAQEKMMSGQRAAKKEIDENNQSIKQLTKHLGDLSNNTKQVVSGFTNIGASAKDNANNITKLQDKIEVLIERNKELNKSAEKGILPGVVYFTESAAKEIKANEAAINELTVALDRLDKPTNEFEILGDASRAAGVQLEKLQNTGKGFTKEAEILQKVQDKTNKQILEYQLGLKQTDEKTTTLRTQMLNLRNEMAAIDTTTVEGQSKFQQLSEELGRLNIRYLETQRAMQGMSANSQALTAIMGVGQGLTGSFTMVQSAMALVGGESEELQKAFFKTQAALQILNGANMLYNTVMKSSVSNVILSNALSKLTVKGKAAEATATTASAAAKTAETVAVKANTAAWLANPVMWIIAGIMAVVGAINLLTKAFKSQKEIQEELNALEERRLEINKQLSDTIKKSTETRVAELQREFDILQSLGASEEQLAVKRRKILQEKLDGAKTSANIYQQDIDGLEENIKKVEEYEKNIKNLTDSLKEATKTGVRKVTIEIEGQELSLSKRNAEKLIKRYQEELNKLKPSVEVGLEASEGLKDISNEIEKNNNEQIKKRADAEKAAQDKRNSEILQAQKQLEDERIKAIEDAEQREIAQIKLVTTRRIEEIKGNSDTEIALRKQVEENAQLEINSIIIRYAEQRAQEEEKIRKEKERKQKEYDQKVIDNMLRANQIEIEAERIKNEEILLNGGFVQRMKARTELMQHELKAINIEADAISQKYQKGIIAEDEYNQLMAEKANEAAQARLKIIQDEEEAKKQIRAEAFDFAVSLFSSQFESEKAALQQRLEDLKQYYTTDEEEAKNNADKKLITEEELTRRELELKRQIAQAEKKQAAFNAGIQLLEGITRIWSQSGINIPLGAAMTALFAIKAAAQIAAINSTPLPQYAKGKKGKKMVGGEMAWVGERGAELMWVPNNASIVPAHKSRNLTPDVMKEFNIHMPEYPRPPYIPEEMLVAARETNSHTAVKIDYGKLSRMVGREVARNIPNAPEVSQLNVSLDEKGFTKHIQKGNTATKVLNVRFGVN